MKKLVCLLTLITLIFSLMSCSLLEQIPGLEGIFGDSDIPGGDETPGLTGDLLVEVSPQTVQHIIAQTLIRPESYYREVTVETFWGETESAAAKAKVWVDGGFTRIDTEHRWGEIGYVLNPAYWGYGFAPEAVRKVLEFGFEKLGLNRIEARYLTENERSLRVMLKCGMTFEGVKRELMYVRGSYRDIGSCSILRREYEAMKKNMGV